MRETLIDKKEDAKLLNRCYYLVGRTNDVNNNAQGQTNVGPYFVGNLHCTCTVCIDIFANMCKALVKRGDHFKEQRSTFTSNVW